MSRTQRRWMFGTLGATAGTVVVALLALLVGGAASADKPAATVVPPAPLVSVAVLEPQPVSAARVFSARAESARRVEVRARVQGILESRLYREGASVKAGDQLFRIEPDRFAVQVERAEAELKRAEATLNKSRRDWKRIDRLFRTGTVSERDRDHAQSALELAEAEVAIAQAALNDARIQLAYTQVKAPIAGITSQEILSEGNLVQEQTLLTTIEQLDPIHIQFAISETDALALKQATVGGDEASVTLLLADGTTYDRPGVVNFAGATVDARTGTVQARAVFRNPEGLLMPGQFLRVSLDSAAPEAQLVVPHNAVAQGERGPVVYVVDGDDSVAQRPVVLGPTVAQGVVVASGLQAGERVVVDGIARIGDSKQVRIAVAPPAASTTAMRVTPATADDSISSAATPSGRSEA